MRFTRICALLGFVFIAFSASAQVFLPEGGEQGQVIQRLAYTLSYNEDHEVANWVAYTLRPEHLVNCHQRRDNFRPDPDILTGSAELLDYRGSGYDRGHLVPAGDMRWSRQAMDETFFLSNMTPQVPRFNQGRWNNLEILVRAWVKRSDEVIIVSGPILHNGLPTVGNNNVSIPEEHFKAILRKVNGWWTGIAFLMPNSASGDLKNYALSIRELENYTGYNFFPQLADRIADSVEGTFDVTEWNFREQFSYLACNSSVVR